MPPELPVVASAVALPFAGAGVTLLLRRWVGARSGYLGALVALASFVLIATQVGSEGTVGVEWVPSLGVRLDFFVDGWALLFALLASGIGVLIFAYSARYMHDESGLGRFYAALLAFMGSIVGVAFASNLVAIFLFWELTSVTSFVLIGHYSEEATSRYSARMAMLVTVGGGLALLAGLVLLAITADGTLAASRFDLAAMLADSEATRAALREAGLFVPAVALIVVAAMAKSAQVPLHFWLPNAMVAPTPVSAFLHSATMVKVGVYFLGRLRPLFSSAEWTAMLATVGLLTMLVGAILAVAATDIKELLAYSTASHLGLMVAGFGLAPAAGGEAGVFHLLNHALFKAPLFLVAGIVAHEVGTRRIEDLSGLWRALPITAGISLVASLSMAGIPPFGGFYSKELLFEAAYETAHGLGGVSWLLPVVATLASVFTVIYSLRFIAMFIGDLPMSGTDIHEPPLAMLATPAVLAVGVAVVSVFPQLAVDVIVQDAVSATAVGDPELHVGLPDHLTVPVAMSAVAIVGGLTAYPFLDRLQDWIGSGTRIATPVSPSWLYDELLGATESAGAGLGSAVHDGSLRTYVTWVVLAGSAVVLAGYAMAAPSLSVDRFAVTVPVALVLALAVVAAVAVVRAASHVAGVLTLSILGFMVAVFYVLASAPDLALTQLVVETLVLLIFLLVLEQLPSFYADVDLGSLAKDGVVAAVAGLTAAVTVLVAMPGQGTEPTALARFFATEAVPGGGGTNIVNVILVDFRGFDTLGELVVISIAALSVLVLVTMRSRGETP